MHGPAVARWVRRHSAEERFQAALSMADAAIEAAVQRVRADNPEATLRDVRAYIKRMRNG